MVFFLGFGVRRIFLVTHIVVWTAVSFFSFGQRCCFFFVCVQQQKIHLFENITVMFNLILVYHTLTTVHTTECTKTGSEIKWIRFCMLTMMFIASSIPLNQQYDQQATHKMKSRLHERENAFLLAFSCVFSTLLQSIVIDTLHNDGMCGVCGICERERERERVWCKWK